MDEVTLGVNAKRKEVKDRPLGRSNIQKKGERGRTSKGITEVGKNQVHMLSAEENALWRRGWSTVERLPGGQPLQRTCKVLRIGLWM